MEEEEEGEGEDVSSDSVDEMPYLKNNHLAVF